MRTSGPLVSRDVYKRQEIRRSDSEEHAARNERQRLSLVFIASAVADDRRQRQSRPDNQPEIQPRRKAEQAQILRFGNRATSKRQQLRRFDGVVNQMPRQIRRTDALLSLIHIYTVLKATYF